MITLVSRQKLPTPNIIGGSVCTAYVISMIKSKLTLSMYTLPTAEILSGKN